MCLYNFLSTAFSVPPRSSRRDDDWGDDPYAPLTQMIEEEPDTERFLDSETLAETELYVIIEDIMPKKSKQLFCTECGATLSSDSIFFENCGEAVKHK